MTKVSRSVSIRSIVLLGLVSLAAGFVAAGQGSAMQTGCTRTITRPGDVHAALAAASPGDTLCFTGGDLAGADLTMTRSTSSPTTSLSRASRSSEVASCS